jgi:lipid-binding SYLF domain-containing protein
LEARRAKIDETAKLSLDQLFAANDNAKALFDVSHGWAAFDNLKIALGITGGGGNGVAVRIEDGARTYMKMGTGGIGLGLGGEKYQVIFLFQNEATFRSFLDVGWQADASAAAAAGTDAAGVQAGFVNGIAVYKLTDTGLIANADITGTKFWKNDKLNN